MKVAIAAILCCYALSVYSHGNHFEHSHENYEVPPPEYRAPGFTPFLKPTALSDVVLLQGSPAYDGQQLNKQYLHLLDQDRLVRNFLVNAGIGSNAQALGGWESPDGELRGHFTGHFMSAVALAYQQYGDEALKTKGDYIVSQLAKAQTAMGTGYLSAFPTSFFDRLEALQQVWAPYYTIHKIMQGLLDMYQHTGNKQALTMVLQMANYFAGRIQKVIAQYGDQRWQNILMVEYGGMPDTMYRLYAITNNSTHSWMAHMFDHQAFLGPLAANKDDLAQQHANTHLPQILGAAARYEIIGDQSYRNITQNFWGFLYYHRMYSTGGTNGGNGHDCEAGGEYWGLPDCLAKTITNNNQETCTSYNTLKILKALITWSGNAVYMDHYERLYINAIPGTQNTPYVGSMLYYWPLAAGSRKDRSPIPWGDQYNSFVCCYGTGVEQWSKMGDSIYFYGPDGNSVTVSLYTPSTLRWNAKGVTITQMGNVAYGDGSVTITINTKGPTPFGLNFHVPYWVANGAQVSINGQSQNIILKPSTVASLSRTWNDKDEVKIVFPMALHGHVMIDNQKLVSVMYGPIVLGGLSTDFHTLATNNVNNLASVITKTSNAPKLTFTAKIENGGTMTMVPLYTIVGSTSYGVYFGIN